MTLEPFFHKRTSLQIGVCDSAWVSECLFCVWEFVFCVCACHLKRERERDWRERKREGERKRLETGWGMTGWIWLRAGMAGRVFVAQRFLNSTFLCASWGRIRSYRRASARGIEQKKDVVRTSSRSGLTVSWPSLDNKMSCSHIPRRPPWHCDMVLTWAQQIFSCSSEVHRWKRGSLFLGECWIHTPS